MKQLTINKENPCGVVTEYANEEEIVATIPTPEQRLEALEAAMLEMIMRGDTND